MDNSQEMNHPSKIDPSPEALGFLEKANNLEEIVQSLSAPPSSLSPPFFSPAPSHDDAQLRGRVRELEQKLQHATGAAREAESRAERAERLLAAKIVEGAGKNAEISELTRAIDGLRRERDELRKIANDTRNEKSELEGLRADNTVLVELMKKENVTKRVLTEEIESLKQEIAEMRKLKRVPADDDGSLMQQLAEMGITNERVAEWVRQNQEREEKQRKKSAHRGTSKNRHGSAVISVKTLDPSKTALTEEERYGDEQEVVCEGCIWRKVNGQWTATVGEKDKESKREEDADIVEKGDDIDKMIEEIIMEKKRRIDSGIDEF